MHLLDTHSCIAILNGSSAALIARLREHQPSDIRLCSIVKAELIYGARKSSRVSDNLRLLSLFFAPYSSLPFDDRCAEDFGMIRVELERAGTPIGPYDLLIAAIARVHDCVLVTRNVREFTRVAGLRVEDWEES